MSNTKRRPCAAFFLLFTCLLLNSTASYAALMPEGATSKSNLNDQSLISKPVQLKRDPNFSLPDISDVFGGYSIDELPTPPPTSARPHAPINDDGLLILELRIGRAILSDTFIGYSKKNKLMLPLASLAESLQLPIRMDLPIGQASGWFPTEEQTFKLDARRRIVTREGRPESIDRANIELRDDDIYVDSELLADWFSIEFNFSFAEQVLVVAGQNNVLLPVQRLAKLQLAREDLRLRPSDGSEDFPLLRAPYQLATAPFSDLNLSHSYDEQSTTRSRTQASLLSHGDALYMNHSTYVAYNKESGLEDIRINLSRKDPLGKLFDNGDALSDSWLATQANKAELTNLEFGDIYSTQLPLTMLNQDGRGVVISNQPLNRADQYDRTSISGDIQPDWEVELYRNEELLAFQRTTSIGRYEFNDVPLLTGLNIFRLVFYGPYGETREETKRILVNDQITKQGESYVRFMAMQQGKNLVNNGNNQSNNFSSSFQTGITNISNLDTRGAERYALEYEYGLADQLGLYLQAAHIPISTDNETNAATIGLAGVWEDVYGRLDISHSDDGGNAAEITLQSNIQGINVSLRHQQFDNYFSDYTEDVNDPVVQRSIVRADGSVKLPWLPRLSLGLAGARVEYDSGRTQDEINQRITTSLFGRAALNHNITFTSNDVPGAAGGPTELTRGNALVSVPLWGAYVRGGVNYGITPDTELQSMSLTADYSLDADTLVRGEVFREFTASKETYQASINKRFKHFSLGLNSGITSDGEKIASLSINTAFGFEPRSGKFRSYADPVSRRGLVSAQTFIDHNGNNQLDDSEEVLEGVGYLVNNGAGSQRSQDNMPGVQMLKYIPTHEPVPISVNPSSIEDPYLVAGDSGVRAITRPGTPMLINFPVKPSADVEGSITLRHNGELKEASNVLVEVLDKHGNVVRSARSAFDGIYLIELLPVGSYTLRISPEQADRLGLKASKPIDLVVTGEEEYLQDMDFSVSR